MTQTLRPADSGILFLDDDSGRQAAFRELVPFARIVTTAAEAVAALKQIPQSGHSWHHVFLDHDLGGEVFVDSSRTDCGMEVVRWILIHRPAIQTLTVHSYNHEAVPDMVRLLRSGGYACDPAPFGTNVFHDRILLSLASRSRFNRTSFHAQHSPNR